MPRTNDNATVFEQDVALLRRLTFNPHHFGRASPEFTHYWQRVQTVAAQRHKQSKEEKGLTG